MYSDVVKILKYDKDDKSINMKTFKFVMMVSGSAKGDVKANSKKEALQMLVRGEWNDIDIDIEDIIEVEHLTREINNK